MKTFRQKCVKLSFQSMLWIACLCFSGACKETLPSVDRPKTYSGESYSAILEEFWNEMNTNYVFWDVDPTDWNQVYTTYQPLFAALTTFSSSNDQLAEKYFTEMTAALIDSHYTITFKKSGDEVSPSLNRKLDIDKIYPDSIYELPLDFFTQVVSTHYIDPASLLSGTDSVSSQDSKIAFTVITGTINNDILYLYLNGFSFSQAGVQTTPVLNSFFASLANLPPVIKGIVLDVRSNGGGETSDLDYLIGQMITSPLQYGYTHSKNGIGRLDFTPWAPAIVSPQPGAVAIKVPIVILADHLSISMAELTTLAVQAMPTGKFIGTTTWGANGPLLPSEYFNGGQFTVESLGFGDMFVYTSSAGFKANNGTVYEGRGISPDIWVRETSTAYHQNVDLQLDVAIKYINSQ